MLRRMLYSQLVGTVLYGGDGIRVGQVRRVLLDEITGRPEWVVVSTGALGARQRLVPIMTADLQLVLGDAHCTLLPLRWVRHEWCW